ncbi:hypothetical protein [Vibrio sp. Hal054]|uniref:hypothetical protein n=1 Tax=Vibrio sp. Hal054 TaxID=3035158 RepID=UPI00301C9EED
MNTINLPALPMRQQFSALLSMLFKDAYFPQECSEDELRAIIDEEEKENHQRLSAALSMLLQREVSCSYTGEFLVYCSDLDDVASMKALLRLYGYKRFETYTKKLPHPDDVHQSIIDPRHPYVLSVHESESLIFGDMSKQWLEMHKDFIDVVRDEISYIYCYNTNAKLTFLDEKVARIFLAALSVKYAGHERDAKAAGKSFPKMCIGIRPHYKSLDGWIVHFNYASQAQQTPIY